MPINDTATLLAQIEACVARSGRQVDAAKLYARAILCVPYGDPAWSQINSAITARWPKGLDRVKKLAWQLAGAV